MDGILDGGLEVWDGWNIGRSSGGVGWMEYLMEDLRCGIDGILNGGLDGWIIGWRVGGLG